MNFLERLGQTVEETAQDAWDALVINAVLEGEDFLEEQLYGYEPANYVELPNTPSPPQTTPASDNTVAILLAIVGAALAL